MSLTFLDVSPSSLLGPGLGLLILRHKSFSLYKLVHRHREVSGVYDLGGGASRMVGALRERIPGASVNQSQGVSVEIGEKQAAVDIDIVAEYGVAIADLAAGIRRNVIAAVERMTGLEVTEVNITVHDVHLDGDSGDDADAAPARVQ